MSVLVCEQDSFPLLAVLGISQISTSGESAWNEFKAVRFAVLCAASAPRVPAHLSCGEGGHGASRDSSSCDPESHPHGSKPSVALGARAKNKGWEGGHYFFCLSLPVLAR